MKRHRVLLTAGVLAAFAAGLATGWVPTRRPPATNRSAAPATRPEPDDFGIAPPDPMYRGRPLVYWRALIKSGGFAYRGWGASASFPEGPDRVMLSSLDGTGQELVPLLLALARDSNPYVRSQAARALATFGTGPNEPATLAALLRLLGDPERCVRVTAAEELRRGGWANLSDVEADRLIDPILRPRPGEPDYGLPENDCEDAGRLSAAELAVLPDRPTLLRLRLGPDAADADLAQLKRFEQMRILDLARTRVTDVGLGHLADLVGLRYVDLTGTAVTADGVARLRQRSPGLGVTR